MKASVEAETYTMPFSDFDPLYEIVNNSDRMQDNAFPELVVILRQLLDQVNEASVNHRFSTRDFVIWIILEVMDTDVGLEELSEWLCHSPTLQEIVFGDDESSILQLLKNSDQNKAWNRYQKLVKRET